jgi:hypothetical protein
LPPLTPSIRWSTSSARAWRGPVPTATGLGAPRWSAAPVAEASPAATPAGLGAPRARAACPLARLPGLRWGPRRCRTARPAAGGRHGTRRGGRQSRALATAASSCPSRAGQG